jgi:Xaa-Pro aminopeptidase
MLLNRQRAQQYLQQVGVDVLIAATPENVLYTTGFYSLNQWLIGGTALGLLPVDGARGPLIIGPVSDMDLVVERPPWAARVIPYGVFYIEGRGSSSEDQQLADLGVGEQVYTTALEALEATLKAEGWETGRLGIDEEGVPPAFLEALRVALPRAEFVDASQTLRRIRMVKTPEEHARLAEAVSITERAMVVAMETVREGLTEREMATIFETEIVRAGALPVFTVIGFGPHSAYPNARPGDRALRRGDIIRFDIGCRYAGYFADIARTAVFGVPDDRVAGYYRAILLGQERGLGLVRAGAEVSAIFQAAVEGTQQAGIPHYRRNHVGHGIGLRPYDPPLIAPQNDDLLEVGMVINIETPYYELGMGGLQVEDTVIVTEDGYRRLTRTSSRLYVL